MHRKNLVPEELNRRQTPAAAAAAAVAAAAAAAAAGHFLFSTCWTQNRLYNIWETLFLFSFSILKGTIAR